MRLKKMLMAVAIGMLAVALVSAYSFAQENTEQTKEKAKVEQKEQLKNQVQVKDKVQNKGEEKPQTQQREQTREQEQVRAEVQKTIENQAAENSQSQTQVRNEIQNRVETQLNEQGQVENQHQLRIEHQVRNQAVDNQLSINKEGSGKPEIEHNVQVKAQEQNQVKNQTKNQIRNEERNRAQNQVKEQPKNRVKKGGPFVDEDGDGINDFYRDHDGDGIPNCQDPDWTAPKDGTGYKGAPEGSGSGQAMNRYLNRNQTMSRQAFRTQTSLAARICDGTGPKGAVARKGNR